MTSVFCTYNAVFIQVCAFSLDSLFQDLSPPFNSITLSSLQLDTNICLSFPLHMKAIG